MSPEKLATSPYERLMRDAIANLAEQGHLSYRAEAIAEAMGRKVTNAFRRTLARLLDDKTLSRFVYFTERGGQAVAYTHLTQTEMFGGQS